MKKLFNAPLTFLLVLFPMVVATVALFTIKTDPLAVFGLFTTMATIYITKRSIQDKNGVKK